MAEVIKLFAHLDVPTLIYITVLGYWIERRVAAYERRLLKVETMLSDFHEFHAEFRKLVRPAGNVETEN